jgi:hypothetical protein
MSGNTASSRILKANEDSAGKARKSGRKPPYRGCGLQIEVCLRCTAHSFQKANQLSIVLPRRSKTHRHCPAFVMRDAILEGQLKPST